MSANSDYPPEEPCVRVETEPNEWGGLTLTFIPLNEEGEEVARAVADSQHWPTSSE